MQFRALLPCLSLLLLAAFCTMVTSCAWSDWYPAYAASILVGLGVAMALPIPFVGAAVLRRLQFINLVSAMACWAVVAWIFFYGHIW